MNRAPLLAALTLALCAPAGAQHRSGFSYANPSAGIAADIALAQLTGAKKGRWHALRETAAPDAVMFAPNLVLAQSWLEGRVDPAPAIEFEPYSAWASCDGSVIVTSGGLGEAGAAGWYTHVWRRQSDGSLKWVFRHNGPLDSPNAAPDMIEARVAECPPRRPEQAAAPPPDRRKRAKVPAIVLDPAGRRGSSRDGSLTWEVAADPGGAHRFSARMRVDGEMRAIRDRRVPAAGT